MCLQYWRAQGRTERCRLLTVRGGYHGDTFGAMAICDPVGGAITAGEGGALMHGQTYMANPPACAAALASTDLLAEGGWRTDVAWLERGLTHGLSRRGGWRG